jgi:amidase
MDALQERVGFMRQWNVFFKDYPVLLCPVSGEPPFPDQLDVQSPEAFKRVWEAQLPQIGVPFMGLPGLTVTTGINGNVPIGVMLVGAQFREELLLQAGEAIERGGPALPYFLEPA